MSKQAGFRASTISFANSLAERQFHQIQRLVDGRRDLGAVHFLEFPEELFEIVHRGLSGW